MAVLYVFDDRAFNVFPRDWAEHVRAPDHSLITNAGEGLSVLVARMLQCLAPGTLPRLRMMGHGSSGHMALSANGLSVATVGQFAPLRGRLSGVDLHGCGVASAIAQQLRTAVGLNMGQQELTPGSLDLPWANTALSAREALLARELPPETGRQIRSGAGVQLLMALSRTVGVRVTGAIHGQMPDREWRFEGPTVTAWGDGLTLTIPAGDTTYGQVPPGSYTVPR